METVAHFLREGTNPIIVALDMTMAFDKCKFSTLFFKISTKIPPVMTRALIFVYEKQYAWTRWGNSKSEIFKITNGTRQGLVLSPALFTVYVQELLDRLQASGMGCHVGHTFLGAVAWDDDFLLSAPSRSSMQSMLDLASSFAREVGLEFSTDPDPAKSKSKAIYMVGRQTDLEKPAPLVLSGQEAFHFATPDNTQSGEAVLRGSVRRDAGQAGQSGRGSAHELLGDHSERCVGRPQSHQQGVCTTLKFMLD